MAKKTFAAVIASGAAGVFCGFFFIALLFVLLGTPDSYNYYGVVLLVVGVFVNSAICFALCLVVYIPVCVYDNNKITSCSFSELLTRYIPIITIPLTAICALFYYWMQDGIEKNIIVIIILNAYAVCYISLSVFTKIIQSANYVIDQK